MVQYGWYARSISPLGFFFFFFFFFPASTVQSCVALLLGQTRLVSIQHCMLQQLVNAGHGSLGRRVASPVFNCQTIVHWCGESSFLSASRGFHLRWSLPSLRRPWTRLSSPHLGSMHWRPPGGRPRRLPKSCR